MRRAINVFFVVFSCAFDKQYYDILNRVFAENLVGLGFL